jgi:hypothetical protein
MKVQFKTFNFKDDPGNPNLGVIAQDLETAFPSLVNTIDGIKSVKYSILGVIGLSVIQQLVNRIEALEATLKIKPKT